MDRPRTRHTETLAALDAERQTVERKHTELTAPKVSSEMLMESPERIEELKRIREQEIESDPTSRMVEEALRIRDAELAWECKRSAAGTPARERARRR